MLASRLCLIRLNQHQSESKKKKNSYYGCVVRKVYFVKISICNPFCANLMTMHAK